MWFGLSNKECRKGVILLVIGESQLFVMKDRRSREIRWSE